MNKLSPAKQAAILHSLCEGVSRRAISRLQDVSINTVTKLLVEAGETCLALHDELVRNVPSARIQCDEIWSFCYAKQRNVAKAESAPEGAGDVWTWTALDADTKLMVSYFVGDRSGESALALADDLRSRISSERVQITTDGHSAYLNAIEEAFGADADYATLEKIYRTDPKAARGRYSPPVVIGIKTKVVEGDPDPAHVSTSYVERANLSIRMQNRRFTRLTNAFSKKFQNHVHALALYFAFYNFVRIHKTLQMTPAMAAGVSNTLWTMEDIVARIEARRPAPAKRGPYKPRISK
ncbi:MAG: IS1 family transposase [Brevundimonas sp.]|uniref:IS1 family transposase n=1 Tax=Brevundimonas sp. TaxID=1871086 RepID=UPI002728CF56|nr:IS1 family transposase [Brevundimonas sp.]MDO9586839.1 IS1 family transposase [Brevundimonas sp.]